MTTAPLSARDLVVGYRGRAILPPATFEVAAGSVCALVGRNGSGKTTMLRTLLGLLPPVGGEVVRAAGGIGYVAQRADLLDSVPARVIGVAIHPGAMALTRTPSAAQATASDLVRPTTALFEAV